MIRSVESATGSDIESVTGLDIESVSGLDIEFVSSDYFSLQSPDSMNEILSVMKVNTAIEELSLSNIGIRP